MFVCRKKLHHAVTCCCVAVKFEIMPCLESKLCYFRIAVLRIETNLHVL